MFYLCCLFFLKTLMPRNLWGMIQDSPSRRKPPWPRLQVSISPGRSIVGSMRSTGYVSDMLDMFFREKAVMYCDVLRYVVDPFLQVQMFPCFAQLRRVETDSSTSGTRAFRLPSAQPKATSKRSESSKGSKTWCWKWQQNRLQHQCTDWQVH